LSLHHNAYECLKQSLITTSCKILLIRKSIIMRVISLCLLFASVSHLGCKKSIVLRLKKNIPADTLQVVPYERRPIVLTGSSTVALWPDSSFASRDLIRVGRGGYHFGEMLNGSARKPAIPWDSLLQLRPKQWIIQGGDNDIYYKRPLSSITADIKTIISKIVAAVPDIRIDFIYAKPTGPNEKITYYIDNAPGNGWMATEKMNYEIATWGTAKFPNNVYSLNAYDPLLLNKPKRLDMTYFRSDLIHLNAQYGYRLLDSLLRPRLLY
jgi:hypothetical protein